MSFTRRSFLAAAGGALGAAGLEAGGWAWSQEPKGSAPEERDPAGVFETMRAIARSVRVRDLEAGLPGRLLRLREEPILRYSDPPRLILDATLWAWERAEGGRPLAALKVEHNPSRPPPRRWIMGLVSLSPGRIEAAFHDGETWVSADPGLVPKPIAGAAAPAALAVQRLAQARELTRRFAVKEEAGPPTGRLTLRLMPRPLARYAEPDAGVLDGFVFAFATGTNPDVLLTIEARDRPSSPGWSYSIGRLGGGEGLVELDGRKVWSVPLAFPPQHLATYMNRRMAADGTPR